MLNTSLKPNPSGVRRAVRAALRMFMPPPDVKVSEWAEANLVIPEGNAKPGPFRLANAPYQREPMDMLNHPDCRRVTLKWGAQVGKTLLALCMQGFSIASTPTSQMMMQPSQGDLQTWLETKFTPMVTANAELNKLLAKPRGREGVNNQRMKSYPGGFMMYAWAGSPKTMRGRSAPLIVCDEVDGYQRTKEGHPVGLLWQRSATFGDQRFLLEISTPTTKGESYIDDAYEAGDQRRFYVQCPDANCLHEQTLDWSNVSWVGRRDTHEEILAHIDEQEPETACYVCNDCGMQWGDGERAAAIRNAESVGAGWRASRPFKGHASYHLNELYSTFRKLRDVVQDYLDKLKTDDLQTFTNVCLAETYEEKGEKVDATGLMARTELYAADVPMRGIYLTAGIDMQPDRLEVETVAWAENEESWSIDYKVLWGDPLVGDVWDDLDDYLASGFQHESGMILPIAAACLDTGGNKGYTQRAYDYLKGKTGRRLFGIKGVGGWGRAVAESPQRKQSGKNARKIDLFLVGTDEAKKIVMRRLGIVRPEGTPEDTAIPGLCHFPAGRDPEWFKQITAEKLITRYVKGQPVRTWEKPDKARNEALDCRVYALAALKIMAPNLHRVALKIAAYRKHAAPKTFSQTVADTAVKLHETLTALADEGKRQDETPSAEIPIEAPEDTSTQTARVFHTRRKLKGGRKSGNFATKW
jgi:phage terminase large subunit GpA-like protein